MRKLNIKAGMIVAAMAMLAWACQKDWDSHNAVTDENVKKDLQQLVAENSSLSKFAELVGKSAYKDALAGSKSYTVFAPTNDALASLDPAIAADTARLNRFIGNHIANLRYFTTNATDSLRILMLNGKYNNMLGKQVETAQITSADNYAKNGVLHVVDKMIPNINNIWEFIANTTEVPDAQRQFMINLSYDGFDPSSAEQIGVDPITGNPIYKPGTGIVKRNLYWDRVYDLRNERQQYTMFALENTPYNGEVTRYRPYFATGSADSTTNLSSFTVIRDFAFPGLYTQSKLPDTLVSKFGVKVPIDKSAIVRSIKASNGIIYVMNKLDVVPKEKFKSIVMQGESYSGSSHDRRGNTFFRDRTNPLSGNLYRDVLVNGHGVALFNLRYRISEVPSMRYRAYWVAVNDFQTAAFTMRLAPGAANATTFAYTNVNPAVYSEVLIGEFVLNAYQPAYDVFLVAANSTTATANPLVCDYIRLEPVL
jgi:uncharacterized surface protein with fasciclin (FAS1) repeats